MLPYTILFQFPWTFFLHPVEWLYPELLWPNLHTACISWNTQTELPRGEKTGAEQTDIHVGEDWRDFSPDKLKYAGPHVFIFLKRQQFCFLPGLNSYHFFSTNFLAITSLPKWDNGFNGELKRHCCLWMGILLWLSWSCNCGWDQAEIQ